MWRVWARGRGFERVQWLHGPCGRPEQWMLQEDFDKDVMRNVLRRFDFAKYGPDSEDEEEES